MNQVMTILFLYELLFCETNRNNKSSTTDNNNTKTAELKLTLSIKVNRGVEQSL